ncbi:MAG: phytanoyl-CoA dioxygenase family protein [Chloroflexaceae bacterium]|nr:phytanoyl-CoA dioxygenase family protein [Chloroflexaceae bacterium]NJO05193.1 phytanoyl-CoA dioxygenase family protein [Chloroflexaceae bacterium]
MNLSAVERTMLIEQYRRAGFVVVPQLFSPAEVAHYREHFMALRAAGPRPHDFAGIDLHAEDPLKRFPRMMHMHHWDNLSLRWLLDARLNDWLTTLLGSEPYAVQTMLYFKPPGARGQALHQDQYFLRVQPGTCMAAWLPLDDCDEENGCMQLVPGTQWLPVLCPSPADSTQSFVDVGVELPEGIQPTPAVMRAGDVLFFNGQVIHGSYPNTSSTRFRRSLIGHYIVSEAERVAEYYDPVLRMDGSVVQLERSPEGGPCGVWIEREGTPTVAVVRG